MGSVFAHIGTALVPASSMAGSSACGPAALEEKRLTDACNAEYGFEPPEARACTTSGVDRLAMRDY